MDGGHPGCGWRPLCRATRQDQREFAVIVFIPAC